MLNKFKLLKEELLLEAVDLTTGENVYRAMQRGQIPFVKFKFFFRDSNKEDVAEFIRKLNKIIIPELKRHTNNQNFNSFLMMAIRKAEDLEGFNFIATSRTNILLLIDSMKAYFDNVNKKEAKENPEIRNKFEVYARTRFYTTSAREFETQINDAFIHKSKVEDRGKEIKLHYDKGGWKVYLPQTFAAAKELACMGDSKANWCTSASVDRYKDYTDNGKIPLYIIRNESRGLMYQLDFGKHKANFQNKENHPITVETALKEIPRDVLSSIKDDEGENLFTLLVGKNTAIEGHKTLEGKKDFIEFKNTSELKKEFNKLGFTFIEGHDSDGDKGYAYNAMSPRESSVLHSGKYVDGEVSYIYVITRKTVYGGGLSFSIKDRNGKTKKYNTSTAFKFQNQMMLPVNIMTFLKLDLPNELNKLLNDYATHGVNLKREKSDSKYDKGEIKEVYSQSGVNIYPLVNNLKVYLSAKGISNNKLTSIKRYLGILAKKQIKLTNHSLLLFIGKQVIYIEGKKTNYVEGKIVVGNSFDTTRVFGAVPVHARRGLLNFFLERDYFNLNKYKTELGKDFDRVTEVILGLRREIPLGKFKTSKGEFHLKVLSGKNVGQEKIVVEKDGVKANVYAEYVSSEARDILRDFYDSLPKEDSKEMALFIRKITSYAKALSGVRDYRNNMELDNER